jgi:hypothetical protein
MEEWLESLVVEGVEDFYRSLVGVRALGKR